MSIGFAAKVVVERTQEFRKNLTRIAQAMCANLVFVGHRDRPQGQGFTPSGVNHLGEIRQRCRDKESP
jgi:hypothetical protein